MGACLLESFASPGCNVFANGGTRNALERSDLHTTLTRYWFSIRWFCFATKKYKLHVGQCIQIVALEHELLSAP